MKRSEKFNLISFRITTNENNVEFRSLNFLGKELMMFPSKMFFATNLKLNDYSYGRLLLSDILKGISELNGEEAIDYYEIGAWKKRNDAFELTIFGKGFYSIDFIGDEQAQIYKMEPENELERLALNSIKAKKTNFI